MELQSNKIDVFPSANRVMYPQSRLTSESNITGILTHILGKDSFVINQSVSDPFEFVIKGYYFKIKTLPILTGNDVYAFIRVINPDEDTEALFPEIVPLADGATLLDNDGYFAGLVLDNNTTYQDSTDKLHILTKVDGAWVIPEDSKLRFTTDSLNRTISIDDGDLDT